jgi:hypothetical protein
MRFFILVPFLALGSALIIPSPTSANETTPVSTAPDAIASINMAIYQHDHGKMCAGVSDKTGIAHQHPGDHKCKQWPNPITYISVYRGCTCFTFKYVHSH